MSTDAAGADPEVFMAFLAEVEREIDQVPESEIIDYLNPLRVSLGLAPLTPSMPVPPPAPAWTDCD
jgi:hypothetical protein